MGSDEKLFDAIEKALERKTAFGDLLTVAEKQYLIDRGAVHSAVPGDVLCNQGDMDTRVFIIVMGEVQVSEGQGDNRVVLAHLRSGEVFGEIAALFNLPRISNVIVNKPSVLLEVPGGVLEKVITDRSELYDAILDRYKTRLAETALRSVDLFRHKNKGALQSLINAAEVVSIPETGVIVSEGELGDFLYIIIRGTARVSHELGESAINLALLKPGDYFGEWSILTGAPRAATVSALTRVSLLRVPREEVLAFIQQHSDVRERIDLIARNRHDNLTNYGLPESPEQIEAMLKKLHDILDQGEKE